MSLSGGTRIGAYEVVSPLGAGGMGEVYRARDTRLGRDVALKVLPAAVAADPDRMARFEREAQLLAALNHAHIAAVYGLEESLAPYGCCFCLDSWGEIREPSSFGGRSRLCSVLQARFGPQIVVGRRPGATITGKANRAPVPHGARPAKGPRFERARRRDFVSKA